MILNHYQIRVTLRLVEQMHYVKKEMGLVLVHAYQNILGIRTQDVGLNVSLIQIAIVTKLVQITDVKIHAQVLVV